jgi:hypothetical protein
MILGDGANSATTTGTPLTGTSSRRISGSRRRLGNNTPPPLSGRAVYRGARERRPEKAAAEAEIGMEEDERYTSRSPRPVQTDRPDDPLLRLVAMMQAQLQLQLELQHSWLQKRALRAAIAIETATALHLQKTTNPNPVEYSPAFQNSAPASMSNFQNSAPMTTDAASKPSNPTLHSADAATLGAAPSPADSATLVSNPPAAAAATAGAPAVAAAASLVINSATPGAPPSGVGGSTTAASSPAAGTAPGAALPTTGGSSGSASGVGGVGAGWVGPQTVLLVRWTMGDSFADSEKEAVSLPQQSTVLDLRRVLEQDSGFVERWRLRNRDSVWSWDGYDLTMAEMCYATLLPSFRFLRSEHVVDILPRQRVPLQIVDDHGNSQWLFEDHTTRLRREHRENEARRELEIRREIALLHHHHRHRHPHPQPLHTRNLQPHSQQPQNRGQDAYVTHLTQAHLHIAPESQPTDDPIESVEYSRVRPESAE